MRSGSWRYAAAGSSLLLAIALYVVYATVYVLPFDVYVGPDDRPALIWFPLVATQGLLIWGAASGALAGSAWRIGVGALCALTTLQALGVAVLMLGEAPLGSVVMLLPLGLYGGAAWLLLRSVQGRAAAWFLRSFAAIHFLAPLVLLAGWAFDQGVGIPAFAAAPFLLTLIAYLILTRWPALAWLNALVFGVPALGLAWTCVATTLAVMADRAFSTANGWQAALAGLLAVVGAALAFVNLKAARSAGVGNVAAAAASPPRPPAAPKVNLGGPVKLLAGAGAVLIVGAVVGLLLLPRMQAGREAELRDAAEAGDLQEVQELIEEGVHVDAQDEDLGPTPLILAANHGHADVVRALLDAGADVNLASGDDYTPIGVAARDGSVETLRMLVEAGADVNVTLPDVDPPIHMAVFSENLDAVSFLVEAGADVDLVDAGDESPLMEAVFWDYPEVAVALLGMGVDMRLPANADAFVAAAEKGQVNVVAACLDAGVDVEHTTYSATALMKAAGAGQREVVKLLVERGASLDARDGQDQTALTYARQRDATEVADFLLGAGASE